MIFTIFAKNLFSIKMTHKTKAKLILIPLILFGINLINSCKKILVDLRAIIKTAGDLSQ